MHLCIHIRILRRRKFCCSLEIGSQINTRSWDSLFLDRTVVKNNLITKTSKANIHFFASQNGLHIKNFKWCLTVIVALKMTTKAKKSSSLSTCSLVAWWHGHLSLFRVFVVSLVTNRHSNGFLALSYKKSDVLYIRLIC